jgi:hypothetical protein
VSDAAAPNSKVSTERSRSKRTVANRRNAQKSTGPKTPEDKRKSSLNAVKHGLHSKIIFADCDTEGRQEYRRLLANATSCCAASSRHLQAERNELRREEQKKILDQHNPR